MTREARVARLAQGRLRALSAGHWPCVAQWQAATRCRRSRSQ